MVGDAFLSQGQRPYVGGQFRLLEMLAHGCNEPKAIMGGSACVFRDRPSKYNAAPDPDAGFPFMAYKVIAGSGSQGKSRNRVSWIAL